MLPSQFLKAKELEKKKPLALRKISNNFLMNSIQNSNKNTLKTIFYMATVIRDLDLQSYKNEEDLIEFFIDRDKVEAYTNIDFREIRNSLKAMQKTSITFVNEEKELELNVSLLPLFEVFWGKNKIRCKIFVKIAKLIIDVKSNYSYLNTKQFMKFENKHSIRMLGLLNKIDSNDRPTDKEYKLKKIKDNLDLIRDYPDYAKEKNLEEENRKLSREDLPKVIELTLNELNEFFGTKYKKWNDFERKVLSPVEDELKNKSPLYFIFDKKFDNSGKGRPKFESVRIYPKLQNGVQTRLSSFM